MLQLINKSKNYNENYAARIARVDEIHPIPDANSIVKAVLGVDTVVVSKDTRVGDIVIFFPVGAAISPKYLAAHNLYEANAAELNSNYKDYMAALNQMEVFQAAQKETDDDFSEHIDSLKRQIKSMTGFFNKRGVVRAIKLRGQASMGYVAPISTVERVWPELKKVIWSTYLNESLDMIGDERLCWKYISIPTPERSGGGTLRQKPKHWWQRVKTRFNRIIPGFFREHYDTIKLEKAAQCIDPGDAITETVKLHGTSTILANLPVRRQLNWIDRFFKALGAHVDDTEYGDIYSTRRVIQNQYLGALKKKDEYSIVYDEFTGFLSPGMTVYGEIVGYKPSGKCIQAPKSVEHDYGAAPGKCRFMPYRITETDERGDVVKEWEVKEVMEWTDMVRNMLPDEEKDDIMTMSLVYSGLAGDQYNLYSYIKSTTTIKEYHEAVAEAQKNISGEYLPHYLRTYEDYCKNKWRIAWLESMRDDKDGLGMELPEPLCRNKAPREGIVIRIVGDKHARAWKLKTKAHEFLAQKAIDSGEVDQEDIS